MEDNIFRVRNDVFFTTSYNYKLFMISYVLSYICISYMIHIIDNILIFICVIYDSYWRTTTHALSLSSSRFFQQRYRFWRCFVNIFIFTTPFRLILTSYTLKKFLVWCSPRCVNFLNGGSNFPICSYRILA